MVIKNLSLFQKDLHPLQIFFLAFFRTTPNFGFHISADIVLNQVMNKALNSSCARPFVVFAATLHQIS
jgi:hypothetical protein